MEILEVLEAIQSLSCVARGAWRLVVRIGGWFAS